MTKNHTRLTVMGLCTAPLAIFLPCLSQTIALPTTALPTRAATYKSIPLDTGGWLSGYAIHSSGRLYAFGDVFGAWRSDDAGNSWTDMQSDFTVNDYSGPICQDSFGGLFKESRSFC